MKRWKENKYKWQIQQNFVAVDTHTYIYIYTDILLIENRFASITELSNAICHGIKEYLK